MRVSVYPILIEEGKPPAFKEIKLPKGSRILGGVQA
jgi:hypothetical protein